MSLELTEYEEGVLKRLRDADKKHISSQGKKRNGIGSVAFAAKMDIAQGAYGHMLLKRSYIQPYLVQAIAKESNIPLLTLDPEFNDPKRWERPKGKTRKANASAGNLLYILDQPYTDRPIAKIGITKNFSQRLNNINHGIGVSDTWWLYRIIDLGTGHAINVETATKTILKKRYKSLRTEVFFCSPSNILEAAIRVIATGKFGGHAMWGVGDPGEENENISLKLEEEFQEKIDDEREYLMAQGLSGNDIDIELNKEINDPYWWN